jgi:heptosyltransferase-2
MKKVAVFLPNWIGDAVMATPALRALRQHFADAELIGVMKPYIAGVLEGAPWLDRPVFLDGKGPLSQRWFAVARQLRREGIDLAVLLPNSFHTALVAWLGGCQRRVGYARYGRRLLLTDRVEPLCDERGHRQPSPVIEAYNLLAEVAGSPPPSLQMQLFTTPRDEMAADVAWKQMALGANEVICLNSGGAFGSAKFWPLEYFVHLAQRFADERGSDVLVLCGPSERELARQIERLARRDRVHSLADHPVSLGLTKACIRRCDLLITTDSGPRHFAAAFDRPVVTLFGPTHIAWTETYHLKAIHLQKEVPCGPCQKRVCPNKHRDHHRCMRELLPDEVFSAASRLLDARLSLLDH